MITNSDLTQLERLLAPEGFKPDTERAMNFSKLFRALLMGEDVNVYKNTYDGITYEKAEMQLAIDMSKVAKGEEFIASLIRAHDKQKTTTRRLHLQYDHVNFAVDGYAKYGLWVSALNMGAAVKPTSATTQQQFIDTCKYFHEDRKRAWYMDIVNSDCDMLFGISKKNLKIFKVPIKRGDDFYNSGKQKYTELSFKHTILF